MTDFMPYAKSVSISQFVSLIATRRDGPILRVESVFRFPSIARRAGPALFKGVLLLNVLFFTPLCARPLDLS